MSCWLKQSTAVDVMLGPFLDSSDGNTPETTLTITQPDIRLSKNGGAFAQKSAAQTLTHGENGWYPVNLSTNDTGTVGTLIVAVHESGALPVWREFIVLPANVYDSLVAGLDFLQTDVAQWVGSAPSALSSGRVQVFVVGISPGGVIDSSSFAAGAINAAAIAAGAIDDDAVAADMDSYAAKMSVTRQSTTADQYGVTFYKNGLPLEAGITAAVIDYVKKLSDGTILVNDASLVDQGNGDYYYGETTNKLVAGLAYTMRVTATIDSSTRVFKQHISRDLS